MFSDVTSSPHVFVDVAEFVKMSGIIWVPATPTVVVVEDPY